VPIIAEKRDMTPSHSHHITARYGLFTLILLGESLFASANPIIEGHTAPARTLRLPAARPSVLEHGHVHRYGAALPQLELRPSAICTPRAARTVRLRKLLMAE
jgi:hypothetical protein